MYRIFEKKKGPIDVPGSLILRPMFAAHPYNHFCTEYPPGAGRQCGAREFVSKILE